MHIGHLLSSLVLLSTVEGRATDKKISVQCSLSLKTNPSSGLACGVFGSLRKPAAINTTTAVDLGTCATACNTASSCVSFGFSQSSQSCQLYGKALKNMALTTAPSGVMIYYNTGCWKQACTTTPNSASASSSASSSNSFSSSSSSSSASACVCTQKATATATVTGVGSTTTSTVYNVATGKPRTTKSIVTITLTQDTLSQAFANTTSLVTSTIYDTVTTTEYLQTVVNTILSTGFLKPSSIPKRDIDVVENRRACSCPSTITNFVATHTITVPGPVETAFVTKANSTFTPAAITRTIIKNANTQVVTGTTTVYSTLVETTTLEATTTLTNDLPLSFSTTTIFGSGPASTVTLAANLNASVAEVDVYLPSATDFATVTSFVANASSALTSTIAQPTDGVNGTVLVVLPSAGTTTLTSFWKSDAIATSTVASASDAQSGTVLVLLPSSTGYNYTTVYYNGAKPSATILAYPSDNSPGLIEQFDPSSTGYATTTAYYANSTTAFSTVAQPTDDVVGTVVEYLPIAGFVTQTSYYADSTMSVTTAAQPTNNVPGTVIEYLPSAGFVTQTSYFPASITTTSLTTVALPTDAVPGTVVEYLPQVTAYVTRTTYWTGYWTHTATYADPTGGSNGTVLIIAPSARGYSITNGFYNGSVPTTSTVRLPSGGSKGLLAVLAPSATVYNTLTSYYNGPSATTSTAVPISDNVPGTLVVYSPSAGTNTVTTFLPVTGTITKTITSAVDGVSGTVQIIEPSAGTYTSSFTSGSVDFVTTIAGSGLTSGIVEYISAEPTTTITSYLSAGASPTNILVPASGTELGTFIVGIPSAGYVTYTQFSAMPATITYTEILATATDNILGAVELILPSATAYVTTTLTVTSALGAVVSAPVTATLTQPVDNIAGTVAVYLPAETVSAGSMLCNMDEGLCNGVCQSEGTFCPVLSCTTGTLTSPCGLGCIDTSTTTCNPSAGPTCATGYSDCGTICIKDSTTVCVNSVPLSICTCPANDDASHDSTGAVTSSTSTTFTCTYTSGLARRGTFDLIQQDLDYSCTYNSNDGSLATNGDNDNGSCPSMPTACAYPAPFLTVTF